MTRPILDQDGNEIGKLTLPDKTTEEEWADKLAVYCTPKAQKEPPTPEQIAFANMAFGQLIIAQVSAEPSINALSTEQTVGLISNLAPMQMMLLTGAIGTVYMQLLAMPPNDIITQDIIDKYAAKLRDYLGL